jgi:hypothetical protein
MLLHGWVAKRRLLELRLGATVLLLLKRLLLFNEFLQIFHVWLHQKLRSDVAKKAKE